MHFEIRSLSLILFKNNCNFKNKEKPKEEVKKTQSLPNEQKPEPTPITNQNTVNLELNQEEPNVYGQQAHKVSAQANKVSASAKQNIAPTQIPNYGQQQAVYDPYQSLGLGSMGIGAGGFPLGGTSLGQNYNTGWAGQNFNVGGGYPPQNQQGYVNQNPIDTEPQNQENNVYQQQAYPGFFLKFLINS